MQFILYQPARLKQGKFRLNLVKKTGIGTPQTTALPRTKAINLEDKYMWAVTL